MSNVPRKNVHKPVWHCKNCREMPIQRASVIAAKLQGVRVAHFVNLDWGEPRFAKWPFLAISLA